MRRCPTTPHYPRTVSVVKSKCFKYGQALQAFREIVNKSGRGPKDLKLHSLRIGGASILAAGGEV